MIRCGFDLRIDIDLLKQQIKDLLDSDIPENSKTGIHNLLGAILDQAEEISDEKMHTD